MGLWGEGREGGSREKGERKGLCVRGKGKEGTIEKGIVKRRKREMMSVVRKRGNRVGDVRLRVGRKEAL